MWGVPRTPELPRIGGSPGHPCPHQAKHSHAHTCWGPAPLSLSVHAPRARPGWRPAAPHPHVGSWSPSLSSNLPHFETTSSPQSPLNSRRRTHPQSASLRATRGARPRRTLPAAPPARGCGGGGGRLPRAPLAEAWRLEAIKRTHAHTLVGGPLWQGGPRFYASHVIVVLQKQVPRIERPRVGQPRWPESAGMRRGAGQARGAGAAWRAFRCQWAALSGRRCSGQSCRFGSQL
ncbi:MAG: hypothetical protein J3K34DRAFT_263939 [Monoraphidium minutum]|nr:MAG: hypothetical protein J3K34DRAFT_263939 [Monoraphidium minutum]